MNSAALSEITRHKEELARLRKTAIIQSCSNCGYSVEPTAFEDCIRVCSVDGCERSKRAVCELWTPKNGVHYNAPTSPDSG